MKKKEKICKTIFKKWQNYKKKIKLNKIFSLIKKYLYVKKLPRANEM